MDDDVLTGDRCVSEELLVGAELAETAATAGIKGRVQRRRVHERCIQWRRRVERGSGCIGDERCRRVVGRWLRASVEACRAAPVAH